MNAVEVHREVDALADEWEALSERINAAPFLRAPWFDAWQRAFGRGSLELVTSRSQHGLQAVLPLTRRLGALSSATNWHTPVFDAVAADGAALEPLVRHVLGAGRRRLDISFLDPGSRLLAECRRCAEDSGFRVLERVIERSPFINLPARWDDYWSSLPSRRRRDLGRRGRRLEEAGKVTFDVHDGSRGSDALLSEGLEVEASGWKGERGTAISSRPVTMRFYRQIVHWAAERGWLRLWMLRLDQKPIAFALCLVCGDVHYVVKVGHDPAFDRFSPGNLLTREMIAAAITNGLRRYEFLGAAEPYKLVFTESCHDRVRLQTFPRTPVGACERMLWTHGRPLAQQFLRLARR